MKGYLRNAIAISADDHKYAALFFDKLYQMHSLRTVPRELIIEKELEFPGGSLMPKKPLHMLRPGEVLEYVEGPPQDFTWMAEKVRKLVPGETLSESPRPPEKILNEFNSMLPELSHVFDRDVQHKQDVEWAERIRFLGAKLHATTMFEKMGMPSVPIIPEGGFEKYVKAGSDSEGPGKDTVQEEGILLTLNNVKVIDTSNASWEQILEFRKDKDSQKMLREFRVWYVSTYSKKGIEFIQDDIANRLEKYERACEKHGFELNMGALTSLFSSKMLTGFAAGAMTSMATGQSETKSAGFGVVAGILVEIGNAVVTRQVKRGQFRREMRSAELAYVFHARKELGDPRVPKENL